MAANDIDEGIKEDTMIQRLTELHKNESCAHHEHIWQNIVFF